MGKVHAFSQLTFLSLVGPDYPLSILPCVDVEELLSVHSDMETAEKPVQNNKKKRSQSDKIVV